MDDIITEIRKSVHFDKPFMFDKRYNETSVIEDTNCFAHAIGSRVTNNRSYYRLGSISQRKPLDQDYYSEEEIKNLFLADTEMLWLETEELPIRKNKEAIIKDVENVKLDYNQYIVVLFAQKYADGKIRDFHFIRFDKNIGWTEKRFRQRLNYMFNINLNWPTFWMEIVGTFLISR